MRARQPGICIAVAMCAMCAVCALLLTAVTPPVASAQPTGGLSVKIVNKTPGGGSTGNLPLSVLVIQSGTEQIVSSGYTDAIGTFVASDLAGPADAGYVISTTYKGVAYRTGPISLPARDVQLAVYESTNDDSKIRVSRSGVVIVDVDPELQRIRFLEAVTLLNSGDRTFLPGPVSAPSVPGQTNSGTALRFGLPDGAGNLVVGEGFAESDVVQIETGFTTNMPVLPGENNVSYAYEMAYGALTEGGYSLVSRNIVYPTDSFQVLAVQGNYGLESPLLSDDGITTVGSRTYRQFSANDITARSEVSFELRDLPLIQPVLRPGNTWLQVVTAGLALVALFVPLLYWRITVRQQLDTSPMSPTYIDAHTVQSALMQDQAQLPALRGQVRRIARRPHRGRGPRV